MRWIVLLLVMFAVGCSSDEPSGNVITEPIIYEEPIVAEPAADALADPDLDGVDEALEADEASPPEPEINEITKSLNETDGNLTIEEPADVFKFNPAILVNSQNGVSFSLDDFEYEIKMGNWGKVTGIFSTVYNENHEPFKPKVIVRVYDETDSIEEQTRPKAEFDYGIEELKQGEHVETHAIINAVYHELNVSKKLEIVLVDGNLQNHRAIALVELEFDPSK